MDLVLVLFVSYTLYINELGIMIDHTIVCPSPKICYRKYILINDHHQIVDDSENKNWQEINVNRGTI